MATAKLSDVVTRLGGRLAGPPDPSAPDDDLLARFLADRNESAFAALVRRHGPMVLGVCRRVTGDHHLAEDAFQAVFAVLAAKAASVRPAAALPAWLYGVAYRTALRARTMADRRRRREGPTGTLPEPAARDQDRDPVGSADLVALLDAEIALLPDRLRLPVVLCELEGKSRRDAAGLLGVPEGTLSSRLAAARKALAARLRQRGVALSVTGLTAALGTMASAAVPAGLTARAVAAAIAPSTAPAPVAALSHGVLRIMFLQKLKTVAVALGLVAGALVAAGMLPAADTAPPPGTAERTVRLAAADTPKAAPRPAPEKPLPKGPNKLLVWRKGELVMVDPDGKNEKAAVAGQQNIHPHQFALSPDGTRVALVQPLPDKDEDDGPDRPTCSSARWARTGRGWTSGRPGPPAGPPTAPGWPSPGSATPGSRRTSGRPTRSSTRRRRRRPG